MTIPASWQEAGWQPVIPPIRSSHFSAYMSCPLSWMLSTRLGLVPLLGWSKALSRGTWAHRCLETTLTLGPDHVRTSLEKALEEVMADRQESVKELGRSQQTYYDLVAMDEHDMKCVMAWWTTLLALELPNVFKPRGTTLQEWLDSWEILETEDYFQLKLPEDCRAGFRMPIVGVQPDAILRCPATGQVWILDLKSTSVSPESRLATCPQEFQTQLYMRAVHEKLSEDLRPKFCGMIHLAFQKPTIEMGMNDRPYELDTTPLRSGPRKGQPRNERVYMGTEPSLDLYLERCGRWYRGEGEHSDNALRWMSSPPINLSMTQWGVLSDWDREQFYGRLGILKKAAYSVRVPGPDFPQGPPPFRGRATYHPFLFSPPADWPWIAAENGYGIRHRSPPLFQESASAPAQ